MCIRDSPCTEQALSQCVSGVTRCLTAHHEVGQTPQILYEHNTNGNCESPQLADRQRLNALIGQHEASKHLRFKTAVGMRNKGPGHFEDARISLERACLLYTSDAADDLTRVDLGGR